MCLSNLPLRTRPDRLRHDHDGVRHHGEVVTDAVLSVTTSLSYLHTVPASIEAHSVGLSVVDIVSVKHD